MTKPFVIGVAGWKNSGKTTLALRLIEDLCTAGLAVGAIKHSHHPLGPEGEQTDSARMLAAGARQVLLAAADGWRIATSGGNASAHHPTKIGLDNALERLAPCDIVVVEGFKAEAHRKIEVRGDGEPLAGRVPNVIAIAWTDSPPDESLPAFRRDDRRAILAFALQTINQD